MVQLQIALLLVYNSINVSHIIIYNSLTEAVTVTANGIRFNGTAHMDL